MNYSVYMESTPNPSVMKFVSNKILVNTSYEFLNVTEAEEFPLIKSIFSFPFVKSVFINTNFISITKIETIDWQNIAQHIRSFILDELNSGVLVQNKEQTINVVSSSNKLEDKVKKYTNIETDINAILQEYITPLVESDGGYISLKSFQDGIVTVSLKGACSGCPSSTITLKNGIESLLKEKIGDIIKKVVASQD